MNTKTQPMIIGLAALDAHFNEGHPLLCHNPQRGWVPADGSRAARYAHAARNAQMAGAYGVAAEACRRDDPRSVRIWNIAQGAFVSARAAYSVAD